jgi:hypothetical protein
MTAGVVLYNLTQGPLRLLAPEAVVGRYAPGARVATGLVPNCCAYARSSENAQGAER